MKIELFTLLMKLLFLEVGMFKLSTSSLYDQTTFYDKFHKDLKGARKRVIIESPFITVKRTAALLPTITKLQNRGVDIVINTKPLDEHERPFRDQAIEMIGVLQETGVTVLMTSGHHRKIAIIDDILYEGSLNILSQNDSCELMRRIDDNMAVREILRFIKLEKWCK